MRPLLLLAALALSACATKTEPMVMDGPPSLAVAAGTPASPQVRLYGDCIAQAAARGSYDREGGLIRFHCDGAPADAFFAGLATWSAADHREITDATGVWRFTQTPHKDIGGLDWCRKPAEASAPTTCTLIFNAGAFVATP